MQSLVFPSSVPVAENMLFHKMKFKGQVSFGFSWYYRASFQRHHVYLRVEG